MWIKCPGFVGLSASEEEMQAVIGTGGDEVELDIRGDMKIFLLRVGRYCYSTREAMGKVIFQWLGLPMQFTMGGVYTPITG